MLIKSTKFIGSFTQLTQCPKPRFPEYAFIGRSNVGKSSLINMLTRNKGLAKVSNTPGKTQHINYFLINEDYQPWYLVDLPGYGYAKVSKKDRAKWEKMIKTYLEGRENLQVVFQLIDSRIKPQANDLEFINWMGEAGIPFVLVFTKTDKQKAIATKKNIEVFQNTMLETWNSLPAIYKTSSKSTQGREEILGFIEELNGGWGK